MEPCKICGKRRDADAPVAEVCVECTTNLGLVAMPPSRRPRLPCPQCRSNVFIRVLARQEHVLDTTSAVMGANYKNLRATLIPTAATYEVSVRTVLVGLVGTDVIRPDFDRPRGLMARYICRRCGFAEMYCEDPESIPIGPEYMSDVIDYGPEAE